MAGVAVAVVGRKGLLRDTFGFRYYFETGILLSGSRGEASRNWGIETSLPFIVNGLLKLPWTLGSYRREPLC